MHLVVNQTIEKEIIFKELVEEVQKRQMQPQDKYEVTAILESMGWNDSMAAKALGAADVFDLAGDIWNAMQSSVTFAPASPVEKVSPLQYFILILRSFLRGTMFALPMAVSVVFMLTLKFSLWSYEYLSLENATSIAIGTILSFMAVGGFTQAIARRGFMYLGQGQYYMARKISFYFVKLGYVVCLLFAVVFLLFCVLFSIFPWRMTIVALLYFLFLSAIWLSVTIMYMLQKELVFTGLVVGGIGIVFVLFILMKINIILSQLIALTIVSIVGILKAFYFFIKAEAKMEKGISPPLPRLSIITYTSIPFFIYGFLYFTFLFTDRVVAWSTNDIYMPYLIWFRGEYELGLDFALIALILPMGLVEVVVNEIMVNMEASQKNYMAADAGKMNRMYVRLYSKRMVYVTLFAVVNALAMYILLTTLSRGGVFETHMRISGTTHFVFVLSLMAYAVVVVALMNALILFCFSQPWPACRSLLIALVVNMFIGFVLSRWVSYSWAVMGLVIGSLVFAVLTSRDVIKVLNNLDYYLYAAS